MSAPEENSTTEFEQTIITGVADIFVNTLSAEGGDSALNEMYDTIVNFVDDITEKVKDGAPPTSDIECAKGCSSCCHKFETRVTPLEVFRIRDELLDKASEDELKVLLGRAMDGAKGKDAFVQKIRAGDVEEDTLLPLFPCPLLENDDCSVYDARPLECKAMNSYSAKTCQDRLANPGAGIAVEGYGIPFLINGAATKGIIQGMEQMGLESGPLDLNIAIGIALTTPDGRERWLKGEKIFLEAVTVLNG